jgi:hypothetical protein
MSNTRHISIFNEFRIFANGSPPEIFVQKSLSCVSLNPSLNYKIKNLTVDVGGSIFKANYIDPIITSPIRFFLSNDPLPDEYNRIKQVYPSAVIKYNGIIQSDSNFATTPISNDIIDSSLEIYNKFELENLTISPAIVIFLNKSITETVAEYNFFSIAAGRVLTGSGFSGFNIVTNNDLGDFYFNSKNSKFLNFSIYPKIVSLGGIIDPSQQVDIYINFTVNFDLEES